VIVVVLCAQAVSAPRNDGPAPTRLLTLPVDRSPAEGHGRLERRGGTWHRACPAASPRTARCFAQIYTPPGAAPASATPFATGTGYGPADFASAYHTSGAVIPGGELVAIVDAYDDPTAESDLATYRSSFGLAPCTTANGCFRKVNEAGAPGPYPAPDPGWALEESLDLDAVSAICPGCSLLLVEASTANTGDLAASAQTAVALGAPVVSNSYGAPEFAGENGYDSYYDFPNVAVIVAAGDSGYGVNYPAASPWVMFWPPMVATTMSALLSRLSAIAVIAAVGVASKGWSMSGDLRGSPATPGASAARAGTPRPSSASARTIRGAPRRGVLPARFTDWFIVGGSATGRGGRIAVSVIVRGFPGRRKLDDDRRG